MSTKLTKIEVQEMQEKYHYLMNYEEYGAPIDPMTYVDSNGDALLHIAAQAGDDHTVSLLLRAGVDVNLTGDMGYTPLHYAKSESMAKLLLSHGASPEIRSEFGDTPAWTDEGRRK